MLSITFSVLVTLIGSTYGKNAICSKTPDDITIDKKLVVYSGKYVFEAEAKLFNDLPNVRLKTQYNVTTSLENIGLGAVSGSGSGQLAYYLNRRQHGWQKCYATPNQFKGCVDFRHDNEDVAEVTSAMDYDGKDFVSYVTKSGIEYQTWGSKNIWVNNQADPKNPTGISFHRDKPKGAEFVIFFGHLVTIQVVNMKRDLPIMFRSDLDYQLANTWLNCEPEFCFDSRVDYAHRGDKNSMVIGRGRFSWKVTLDPSSQLTSKHNPPTFYQDIVYTESGLMTIGDGFVDRPGDNASTTLAAVFSGTKFDDVDAAFRYPNNENKLILILTSGSDLEVYEPAHRLNDFVMSDISVISVIQELSRAGFDAGALSSDNILYLFKNNFYYKYHASDESLFGPELIQGNLFSCTNSFYENSKASKQLNIKNLAELENYRRKFEPAYHGLATTAAPSMTRTLHIRTTKRRPLVILISTSVVLILSSLMLAYAIRLAYLEKREYDYVVSHLAFFTEEAPSSDDLLIPTLE
ncbi:hypothetical protein HDE_13047 [Halotydeus destructor]|nr:hypothetical protein HDE_13047 [Halotydeus destructor]